MSNVIILFLVFISISGAILIHKKEETSPDEPVKRFVTGRYLDSVLSSATSASINSYFTIAIKQDEKNLDIDR